MLKKWGERDFVMKNTSDCLLVSLSRWHTLQNCWGKNDRKPPKKMRMVVYVHQCLNALMLRLPQLPTSCVEIGEFKKIKLPDSNEKCQTKMQQTIAF